MVIARLKSRISDGTRSGRIDRLGAAYVCPEGASVNPAKGAALENRFHTYRAVGPTAQQLPSVKINNWPVGPTGGSELHGQNQGCALRWANCWAFGPGAAPRPRRGMTLIELLVVVAIVLFAAAIFVPRLQPLMDHSKVREAARVIQLYLSTARNQAMATGRGCGVMIEPLPSDTGCAMTLSQVETPPPYSGSFQGSYATVSLNQQQPTVVNQPSIQANCNITFFSPPTASSPKPVPEQLTVPLHAGDLIQIGYQGYSLLVANNVLVGSTSAAARLEISHGETPAWLTQPSVSGPYKIVRWPTKSAARALQLPAATCIDLTWSGFDPAVPGGPATWPIQTPLPTGGTLPTPVIISFASDGKLDWVSNSSNPSGQTAITPVYLLVGMRKKVIDNPATDPNVANTNLNDFNSLWISIDAASGLILTSDPAAIPVNVSSITSTDVSNSRANARQASANGGGK